MSFYYELTDVTKNLEVEQWEINSEAFALCSTTPFSLRKKTLHGGKQEGSTIIDGGRFVRFDFANARHEPL